MKKNKSLVYPVIFVLVLTAILTFLLSGLNYLTTPVVEANAKEDQMRKVLYVFNQDTSQMDLEEVTAYFNENVKEVGSKYDFPIYAFVEDGKETAYALPVEGPGLWGLMEAYVGVKEDYSEITGLEFIKQEETPGLGGRIAEEWYKEQFRGIPIAKSEGPYVINNPAPGGNVDAISGATQTSAFVVDMVNQGVQDYILRGGANDG